MRYRAFFSYARADDRIANWLHRQLDGYRTPKALVGTEGELGPVPAKLHPIFRDRTDLESGGHVDAALQQALQDSETLIVLCTPTSAKSHWVNHEVETFLNDGREAMIFPVIAAGLPDSGDPETECFPPALRNKGLLAADLREIKLPTGQLVGDGREGGRLKLIAGLLGVKLDALVQRERRRQRQVMAALGAAAITFAGVAVAAGGFWWLSTQRANTIAQQTVVIGRERDTAQENEKRAVKGEEDARAAQALAEENARQREIQRLLADKNAFEAQSTLHRFFATQAWARHNARDYLTAARYALAGMRLAPENRHLYWAALAATMHEAGESAPPFSHEQPLRLAKFSPDGGRIATLSKDGDIHVWNARSGTLIYLAYGDGGTESLVFSTDGARIMTTDDEGDGQLFDAQNGASLGSLYFPQERITGGRQAWIPVRHVVLSDNGARAVYWTFGTAITVWNTGDVTPDSSGDRRVGQERLIATFAMHKGSVTCVAMTGGGARIVTIGSDGNGFFWSTSDGQVITSLSGLGEGVLSVAISLDETRIATANENGTAAIWDARNGTKIVTLSGPASHTGAVRSVAFSSDGSYVVTSGDDRTARVWDAGSGQLVAILSGHEGTVTSAVFASDGARVLTSGADGVARIWDLQSLKRSVPLRGFEQRDRIVKVALSPDRTRLLTMREHDADKPQLWDTSNGRLVGTLSSCCGTFDFSSDSRRVLTTTLNSAGVWSARDGNAIANLPVQSASIVRASISPDGDRAITVDQDWRAMIWNTRDGRASATPIGGIAKIDYAVFSPDGTRVATTDRDASMLRIWNVRDGSVVTTATMPRFFKGEVLAFSPDGTRVIANEQRSIGVWNTRTGKLVSNLNMDLDLGVQTAAFSASGDYIVATARKSNNLGSARIFDVRDGSIITTIGGEFRRADFSRDGARVLTSTIDGVQVWDARDGRRIAALGEPGSAIADAAFTRDETGIIAVTDKAVVTWGARHLTHHWEALEREACLALGPIARLFSQEQIDLDQLLIAEWRADRDVCEGVAGVPSIAELRRRAGLPAVAARVQ